MYEKEAIMENMYSNRHGPDFDVGRPRDGTRGSPHVIVLPCSGGRRIRYLYPASRPPGNGNLSHGTGFRRRTTAWSTCLAKREWERYALTDLKKNLISGTSLVCIHHVTTSGYVPGNYEKGYNTAVGMMFPFGYCGSLLHVTRKTGKRGYKPAFWFFN